MSRYCGNCGSVDFTLVDGFFYCAVCNTQSQILREFDHEDQGAVATSLLTTKIRQKKGIASKHEKGKKVVEEESVQEEEEYRLPALKQEDFPKYLGHAGLRLSTFTKLLSRFSAILIRDFGVAECVKLHVLNILQRYLQHYHVAFCTEELDEENPYCPLVKNEEYEAQMKAKEKQIKTDRERQLKRGDNVMTLLSSADISADLDAQITELDTKDIKAVVEQRTKLSRAAVSTALKIPVNIEMIIAILYVGCLFSGASWMLLSDITRWFREGRFPMSVFHRMALIAGTEGCSLYDSRGVSFCPPTPIMPLHEYVRTVLVLSQLTCIPVQPVPYSFDRILARLSYNLNLPFDFMRCLHVITDAASPNVVFDVEFTRRFGVVHSETFLKKTHNPYCDNISLALENSICQLPDNSNRQYSVLPSVEIKAVVIILFALKLIFGLNDNLEFNMKKKVDVLIADDELFNFGIWKHQLKMRMNVWRGRRLKDVLEKRANALPDYDAVLKKDRLVRQVENRKGKTVTQIGGKRCVGGRNLYFKECVPNYHVMDERDYALFSTFEDDFDLKPSTNLEKEALLTPLRYQATRNREWYEKIFESDGTVTEADLSKIDRYNAEVFFKSFKHHCMIYAMLEMPADNEAVKSEGSCSSDIQRTSWRQLFPCSNHYEAYPRPVYCSGLVKPTKSGEHLYVPLIYKSAVDTIYQCASPYFSDSFAELLEIFSLMIGEDLKIVYTFFLMLEMKCLMPKTMEDLYEIAENCDKFTTCAQIEFLNDKPHDAEVQMHRVDENVARADSKFIVNFGNIDGIEELQSCKKRLRQISKNNHTPAKRLRKRVKRKQAYSVFKTSMKEAVGIDEVCGISAATADSELSNDFERMILRPGGKERSLTSAHEEVSFGSASAGDEDMQNISDDEVICDDEPAQRKDLTASKSRRCRVFRPTHKTLKMITSKYTEYFAFEFGAAFALAMLKYW